MARLSSCIFEWDAGDLTLLRRAKREQLTQQGWPAMTEAELDGHISKDELLKTAGGEHEVRKPLSTSLICSSESSWVARGTMPLVFLSLTV